MDQVVIFLLIVINLMILIGTSVSRDKWKGRCRQLREYIKFIESSEPIEDAQEGANWLNERAQRKSECDIQDINYE